MTTLRLLLPLAAVATAAMVGASGIGCGSEPTPLLIGSSSSSGVGGSGGGDGENQGREMFDLLLPDFTKECASCHAVGGPADTPFLGDPETGKPDPYERVTSWPGFVVKDPTKSRLLVHSVSSEHKGTKPSDALKSALEAWLEEEAKAVKDVSEEPQPTIPPFKPIVGGFNAVYLGALGPGFEGMAVTFQAEELTATTLSLTEIEVHPTGKMGVKLTHPLFTVYRPGTIQGDPDPVDSFSNVTVELVAGASGPLGPGLVVLTNWKAGSKLSLAFETATVIDPNGGVDPNASPCKALEPFQTNAAPALGPCVACHGGTNSSAQGALDMSDLTADPGLACGQVRNRVNLMAPGKSQLFVTTNPAGATTHPFKFGGNAGQYNTFKDAVTLWIQEEAK